MDAGLYANLGNTALQLGVYRDGWLVEGRLDAAALRRDAAWAQALTQTLCDAGGPSQSVRRAVLCASTPHTDALCRAVSEVTGLAPLVLGHDLRVPMAADYDPPGSLGQDRLLAGYTAAATVGRPCVVLDAGTCVTCEAVSADGALLPIAIAPGLPALRAGLSAAASHLTPALDRAIAQWGAPGAPARCSEDSLLAGLCYCLAGTARELVAAARAALRCSTAPIAVTGGDAHRLLPALGSDASHHPLLLLDGLRLLADEMGL